MLRLVQVGNTLPLSYPVDPSATFQAGQIAQLKVIGNEIVCGVSDGTAPMGIIDDINASAFTAPVHDEVVIVPLVGVLGPDGYTLIAAQNTEKRLRFSNIVRSSFVADVEGLILHDVNGVIEVQQNTPLNFDRDGDGIKDSLRTIVSYVYRIPNIPGDNTTSASGRVTVWFQRGIFETDQYDTKQRYVVNAALFVNEEGLLTSRQPSSSHPGVAICTGPPSGIVETLEFLWL